MTHSHVWHDSFIRVISRLHIFDVTLRSVHHISGVYITVWTHTPATHCNTLQHTVYITVWYQLYITMWYHMCLQHTATHCNTLLQHTATHCNTQCTSPCDISSTSLCDTICVCNTLQHTATHSCNTHTHVWNIFLRLIWGLTCLFVRQACFLDVSRDSVQHDFSFFIFHFSFSRKIRHRVTSHMRTKTV